MLLTEGKKLDPRMRRTRQALVQAFMGLAQEKGFQNVTVQDIAARAEVNRATFYDHFVDKYALREYAMREMLRESLGRRLPPGTGYSAESLHTLIVTMCEFLAQADDHACAHSPGEQAFQPMFEAQATEQISALLLSWVNMQDCDHAPPDSPTPRIAATITSWAIYGAAVHWSRGDRREPAASYARKVATMFIAGMAPAFANGEAQVSQRRR